MFFCLRLAGYAVFAFLISFGLLRFCYLHTHGFALSKILSSLKPSPLFENPTLTEKQEAELRDLFNQPFYYLGKGAQSYVFISENKDAVIKFCRFDHLRPSFWFSLFHFPFCIDYEKERIAKILHKRGRLEHEFGSYQIAFDHLKQETGLLYLHLNKSASWKQTLTLYDNLKVRHLLSVDKMEFIVQKRATLVYPTIDAWMAEKQEASAQEGLSSLLQLLIARHGKGISDKDPDIATNFGFLGTSAIQIDTGRFSISSEDNPLLSLDEELRRITHPLIQWLQQNHPSLAIYLEKELTHLCQESPC